MSTKQFRMSSAASIFTLDELAKEQAVDYGFSLTLFDTVVALSYKA